MVDQKKSQKGCARRLLADCLPKWWTEDKPQKSNASRLSISTGGNSNTSSCNIEFTEVELLVLNLRTKNYSLPDFMKKKNKKMKKAKVLIVTNYHSSLAEFKNFNQLCSLRNLRRMRLEKISVPSFRGIENFEEVVIVYV
ncbi:Disease resistance protein [Quillaja saponaria]|uniref:Disease resistance protein n=1 Tax=Quillaja saponaria TaxID=32244 RepID=A0AAD7L4P9_QUISA|nr:Disease resistance protein [Quillaja saponaria]